MQWWIGLLWRRHENLRENFDSTICTFFEAIAGVINEKWRKNWSHLRRIKQCIYKTFCLWKPGGRKGSTILQALSHLDPSTERVQVCGLLWAKRVSLLSVAFSKIGNVWQCFLVKQHPRFLLWGCCQCSHTPCGCRFWGRVLPNSNLSSPHITVLGPHKDNIPDTPGSESSATWKKMKGPET